MDRSTVIGFILVAILVTGYLYFIQPSPAELQRQKVVQDSIERVERQHHIADSLQKANPVQTAAVDTTNHSAGSALFSDSATAEEQSFTIENELLKLQLSSQGGKIVSVELKKYKTYDHKPLVLFNPQETKFGYTFFAGNTQVETNNLLFKPESPSFSVTGKDSGTFVFRAYKSPGQYVEQRYELKGNSYSVGYSFSIVGMDTLIHNANSYMSLVWDTKYNHTEQDLSQERNSSSVYFRYWNDDVDNISERSTGDMRAQNKVQWVSNKTHFFNATLITQTPFEQCSVSSQFDTKDTGYVKQLKEEMVLPYPAGEKDLHFLMQFYFGPNSYYDLKSKGIDLEQIIPLNAGIFGIVSSPLNKLFFIPLFNFLNDYISNYGLIILIMTILLRLILFPFTYRSFISAAKMKILKPEIDELKAKYGGDQAKFGTEQMSLFKKAGVNPLGGCLPMVFQLPILVAMYTFFPQSIELRQQSFLWAKDLSAYDSVLNLGVNIPFYGSHVSLFTILMTLTSIGYAVYNNQLSGVQGQMKWMAYIMPVMLLGVFNSLPSALTYYYTLSNIVSFGQQFFIKNFVIDEAAIHRQIQENKKKQVKKSKWQKRLEDMQRTQQQQRKKK